MVEKIGANWISKRFVLDFIESLQMISSESRQDFFIFVYNFSYKNIFCLKCCQNKAISACARARRNDFPK
jgi:hypothetical protein